MSAPTSVRLTQEAEAALAWLREQMGGFNFNQAVSQVIVAEAIKRGWRAEDR